MLGCKLGNLWISCIKVAFSFSVFNVSRAACFSLLPIAISNLSLWWGGFIHAQSISKQAWTNHKLSVSLRLLQRFVHYIFSIQHSVRIAEGRQAFVRGVFVHSICAGFDRAASIRDFYMRVAFSRLKKTRRRKIERFFAGFCDPEFN